jgi:hypothetical protein
MLIVMVIDCNGARLQWCLIAWDNGVPATSSMAGDDLSDVTSYV